MSWLGLEGKVFLVTGVANKKSVAWQIAKQLEDEGARVIYSVRSEERRDRIMLRPERIRSSVNASTWPRSSNVNTG